MVGKRPTLRVERQLLERGYQVVAGLDEVGRGPAAGPVTVGAVVLPVGCRLPGVRDSKQLTLLQRQQLAADIRRRAIASALMRWG
jgi:ribonuclease HII